MRPLVREKGEKFRSYKNCSSSGGSMLCASGFFGVFRHCLRNDLAKRSRPAADMTRCRFVYPNKNMNRSSTLEKIHLKRIGRAGKHVGKGKQTFFLITSTRK